jgi:hypothetical protein
MGMHCGFIQQQSVYYVKLADAQFPQTQNKVAPLLGFCRIHPTRTAQMPRNRQYQLSVGLFLQDKAARQTSRPNRG